jgi:hypothetical protein
VFTRAQIVLVETRADELGERIVRSTNWPFSVTSSRNLEKDSALVTEGKSKQVVIGPVVAAVVLIVSLVNSPNSEGGLRLTFGLIAFSVVVPARETLVKVISTPFAIAVTFVPVDVVNVATKSKLTW